MRVVRVVRVMRVMRVVRVMRVMRVMRVVMKGCCLICSQTTSLLAIVQVVLISNRAWRLGGVLATWKVGACMIVHVEVTLEVGNAWQGVSK